ncbi:unnamed protein product [Paramecium pentaurelia]|uniref:Uncharacterized protein n=1 Tax=Paramecium pentaurelia TaxID=43138 RepID=A0A8S1UK93_9CILI|nr:unnamed protein product [Paramecium pentaurelia]CAD8165520.1 unnamed protein product [Paramecium pentaurelia]
MIETKKLKSIAKGGQYQIYKALSKLVVEYENFRKKENQPQFLTHLMLKTRSENLNNLKPLDDGKSINCFSWLYEYRSTLKMEQPRIPYDIYFASWSKIYRIKNVVNRLRFRKLLQVQDIQPIPLDDNIPITIFGLGRMDSLRIYQSG